MNEFDELVSIVKKLREECPWDMEQTHESLSRHLIEEAYELLDALASIQEKDSNYALVKDELGDLLLQILLHSKIAKALITYETLTGEEIENIINKNLYPKDKVVDKPEENDDQSSALGDGMNDIEMLKESGVSVAMGNSVEELFKISKYSTKKYIENGTEIVLDWILRGLKV